MSLKKIPVLVLVAALAFTIAIAAGCASKEKTTLVLATTTSTMDSGLLDVLVPQFEKDYDAKVKTLAVGTGEALEMGRRGDADVLLVHSRQAEEDFVKDGFGLERVQVMYNDFIIVGPQADPAGVGGGKNAVVAFKEIAAAGNAGKTVFVSRADDSGTNKAELKIWKDAGVNPKGKRWYFETGQGMGETLTISSQKKGYTLSDRATELSSKGSDQLVILVEGDPTLDNQYGVEVVNPQKHPKMKLNTSGAGDFVQFLTSREGQSLIGAYKLKGVVLFYPNATGETRGMDGYKEK